MLNVRRTALAAGLIAALGIPVAWANGLWPTVPTVGGSSFCAASIGATPAVGTQTGQGAGSTICAQTVPAGPTGLTGNELIPADTNLSGGVSPQTVRVPVGILAPGSIYGGSFSSYKNLLRNGDISVNPFQVGTSQAADITNAISTAADGFRMLGGASSAINWSSQTGATDIVANQFTKSLRFQRKSANADTAAVCQINVLTSADSVALQGQQFVYSFWAKPGANFSPTSGNIVVTVASGTGTDQSSANLKAGSWTGQANAITATASSNSTFPAALTGASPNTATISTLPSGSTATWVQYWVSGAIPTTATQVGTEICFTPIGTAGTNDWIETSNHQLEIVGPGVLTPSAFEHHSVQQDLTLAQRFLTILTEPASGVQVPVVGNSTSATAAAMAYAFPVTMRAAPTFTALGTALSGSTWTNKCGNVNNALATTFIVTATANTVSGASLTVTSSGSTIGFGCVLVGAGGGSILSWSAEL